MDVFNDLFECFLILQRIMPNSCSEELLKAVINRLQKYKFLMSELGYSNFQVNSSLLQLLPESYRLDKFKTSSNPAKQLLNKVLGNTLNSSTTLNTNLTKLLVNLQVQIISLLDGDSQSEQQNKEIKQQKNQKKEKIKKRKESNKRKKGKNSSRSNGLQQIRSLISLQTDQMSQNIGTIAMLREFLGRKASIQLIQQAKVNSIQAAA